MFRHSFYGQNGFDELRRHVKAGNELCKEVGLILQERAEAEATFAKSLSKLSARLVKATNACFGTLARAWQLAATEMEIQADLHKHFSTSLHDEVCKPIKSLAEQQHKARKPIEAAVEKAHKALQEKRAEETRMKKTAFSTAKEREKVCDSVMYARSTKGKALSEKEIQKLQKKCKTFEEQHLKADLDYLEICRRAEASRQDWESSIYRGSSQMQTLEEERIGLMQDFLNRYNTQMSVIPPQLQKSCDKMSEAISAVNCTSDLREVISQKGTTPTAPEQLLPDFFAEEKQNVMDKDRRRQALVSYIGSVEQNLEKETKARDGVQKLMDVYVNKPNYGDQEAQAETQQKLAHVNSTINYLEAMHYKFSCGLAELEAQPKPDSRFSSCIERSKDKQGIFTSILKVPLGLAADQPRGPADGGHVDSPYDRRESSYSSSSSTAAGGLEQEAHVSSTRASVSSKTQFRKSTNAPPPPNYPSKLHDPPPAYPSVTPQTSDAVDFSGGESHLATSSNGGTVNFRPNSSTSLGSLRKPPRPPETKPVTPPERPSNQPSNQLGNRETYYPYEADEFPTDEPLCYARAIYDYEGQHYDELSIKIGVIVKVFEQQNDGWWRCELDDKEGVVPASYLEILPDNP